MNTPKYNEIFKSKYSGETEKQLLERLKSEGFDSFFFVLSKTKIIKSLIKSK